MTDNLGPAGVASYHSNTLNVGDGTWDRSTKTFLLPNLQGWNLATTQYNGMGNRFKGETQYHTYILGHGVLAAITFIGILPLAIFLAKYGHDWPGGRVSFKLHVYLQIITVFLSTVILVLGWFAVGPVRSLSNPHHGIGVAIYVLILFQFLYGTCWFRRERKRKSPPRKLPLAVWLHRLLGRATALLAFIEIGLGLTLYGSPKTLFILYALAGAFLLFMYLALDYYYMPRTDGTRPGGGQPEFYSDYGSAVSGSAAPPRKKEHHWGRDLLAAGGLVGAYEWFKQRRDGRREDGDYADDGRSDGRTAASSVGPQRQGPPYGAGPPPPGMAGARSRRPNSQSGTSRDSGEDEKYGDRRDNPTWRDRMLEATGAFAAYEGARSLFNRRKRRDDDYVEDGNYGSGLGGNRDVMTETDVSRVQAGDAPSSPETPRVNMGDAQPMTPTMTPTRPGQPRPLLEADAPLSEHVRELGPIAGLREWNRSRKTRRETDRAEDVRRRELENEEEFNRRNSNHYPRPQDASNRRMSTSGTLLTGPSAHDPGMSDMSRGNVRPDTSHPPLPADAGYTLPPPPPGPPPNMIRSDGYGSRPDFGSAYMPEGAVQPDPRRLLADNTAANESSAYGRDPTGRDAGISAAAAGIAGVGAGAAGVAAMEGRRGGQSRSPSRGQDSRNRLQRPSQNNSASASNSALRPDNPNSPPVSVKVKMHNDGRHVTLRRLNEQEAAAERESRRQDRRRRRGSSLSSGAEDGGGPSLGQRFRRNGGMRDSSQQPIRNVPPPPAMSSSANASFRRESNLDLPPAPQVPQVLQHSSPASGQGLSPPVNESGAGYGTDQGTDVSAFENNRKRRRAERARRAEAAAAAANQEGSRVEFQ